MLYTSMKVNRFRAILYAVLVSLATLWNSAESTTSEDSQKIYRIVPFKNRNAVELALKSLKSGKIIAVPTDTVYGFAVDALNPEALEDLYTLIKRPYWKPVVMCVDDVVNVTHYGAYMYLPPLLLEKVLPGPVTVLLTRQQTVPYWINPGIKEIGFRVFKKRSFLRQIAHRMKGPLILSGATTWNRSHSIHIEEFKHLWTEIDIIFDGGKLDSKNRAGSTFMSLAMQRRYQFVRRGCCCPETKAIMMEQTFMDELPYFPNQNSYEIIWDSLSIY